MLLSKTTRGSLGESENLDCTFQASSLLARLSAVNILVPDFASEGPSRTKRDYTARRGEIFEVLEGQRGGSLDRTRGVPSASIPLIMRFVEDKQCFRRGSRPDAVSR